jgi:dTDP-4-dehydrorhamnose reductase
MLRLASERSDVYVVADQVGCPTFTGHLALALVQLATAPDRPVGITHVAGAGRCSWFEFASGIVEAAGLTCEVKPCTTAEYPLPAPRPAFSVLCTERGDEVPRLPGWEQGLSEFIEKELART